MTAVSPRICASLKGMQSGWLLRWSEGDLPWGRVRQSYWFADLSEAEDVKRLMLMGQSADEALHHVQAQTVGTAERRQWRRRTRRSGRRKG